MEHTRPAFAAAALLALAAPSLAVAQVPPTPPTATAAVTLDAKCYTPGEPVTETGSGFTPGGQVQESLALLSEDTTPLATLLAPIVAAGPDGTFTRRLKAPDLMRDNDRRELATSAYADLTDPQGKSASVQWTLSAWFVDVPEWNTARVALGDPRRKMTVDAYGWTNLGPSLYAHYYRGSTQVRSVKIGALTGDCKTLRKRVRQFPFKAVKPGLWTVYFSTTALFNKRTDAWGRYRVRVPKA